MQLRNRIHSALTTIALLTLAMQAQTPTGTNRQSSQDWPTGPYQVVENWPKPLPDTRHSHDGWTWGSMGSVFAEVGVRGRGPNTFDRPTDIAWLPDGTYFISDGYGGKRVAKFDRNDKFLLDWGQAPANPAKPGPSEFNTPHSIAVSADRRVYVIDRGHERMQVFDENGKFLDMWPLRSPHWPANLTTLMTNHVITQDQFIWVGDAGADRILKFDLKGNFLYSWGAPGSQAGRLDCPHGISTDQERNLYIADCFAGRVQKFTPQPGADPARLVGQILRYPVGK
jgi:DNA-binding beta-propeller fold protein YncE